MESPPPLACYLSQKSKKRVFPGSSSSCMEAEVVEIEPPVNRSSKSKSLKQKEVYYPEIIDVDVDDGSDDIMLIPTEADTCGKGKETFPDVSGCSANGTNHVPGDAIKSSEKNYDTGSHKVVDVDDFGSDMLFGENEYMDMFSDDQLYDDQYAMLQSHFDHLDIPPGVEVPIPWLTAEEGNKMKLATASTSAHPTPDIQLNPSDYSSWIDPSPSWALESDRTNQKPVSGGSLTIGDQLQGVEGPQKLKSYSKSTDYSEAKKKSFASKRANLRSKLIKNSLNSASFPPKQESLKSIPFHESSHSKRKPRDGYNTAGSSPQKQFPAVGDSFPKFGKHFGSGGLYDAGMHAGPLKPVMWTGMAQNEYGISSSTSYPQSGFFQQPGFIPVISEEMPFGSWSPIESQNLSSFPGNSSDSSGPTIIEYGSPDEILKKFDLFKKFDTVQDCSDHYYNRNGSSLKQSSKSWSKKIQEEWRILERDLPETILVRVYESRMDLLRAVIIGAEGTPYHDGLFFFDMSFPSNYPNVPPLVHYHSGGLRINPNLYNCGKVCLSLLNTWSGSQKEKWIPGLSTTLQVLVSIQGLILNADPFFNEPGYANMSGTPKGEKSSLHYNENTFISSLKTMVYSIRRPPKYFEDFVAGHFLKHGHDILVACKAYIGGAQVGCLVKGGVQDVDEGDKSCSQDFRNNLAGYIKTVVEAFTQVGVKDCGEFLSVAQKATRSLQFPVPPIYPDFGFPDFSHY